MGGVPNSTSVSAFYQAALRCAGHDVTTASWPQYMQLWESTEREGSVQSWNAGVHPHEVMRIEGSLHREEGTMWIGERKTDQRGGTTTHKRCWGQLWRGIKTGILDPATLILLLFIGLSVQSYGGQPSWLAGVGSIMCRGQDGENEAPANWMWSGLLVADNAAYCAGAAVEPHHQHNALQTVPFSRPSSLTPQQEP